MGFGLKGILDKLLDSNGFDQTDLKAQIDTTSETGIKPMPELGLGPDDFTHKTVTLEKGVVLDGYCLVDENGKLWVVISNEFKTATRGEKIVVKQFPTSKTMLDDFEEAPTYTLEKNFITPLNNEMVVVHPEKSLNELLGERDIERRITNLRGYINEINNGILGAQDDKRKNDLVAQANQKIDKFSSSEKYNNLTYNNKSIEKIETFLSKKLTKYMQLLIQLNTTLHNQSLDIDTPEFSEFEAMSLHKKIAFLRQIKEKTINNIADWNMQKKKTAALDTAMGIEKIIQSSTDKPQNFRKQSIGIPPESVERQGIITEPYINKLNTLAVDGRLIVASAHKKFVKNTTLIERVVSFQIKATQIFTHQEFMKNHEDNQRFIMPVQVDDVQNAIVVIGTDLDQDSPQYFLFPNFDSFITVELIHETDEEAAKRLYEELLAMYTIQLTDNKVLAKTKIKIRNINRALKTQTKKLGMKRREQLRVEEEEALGERITDLNYAIEKISLGILSPLMNIAQANDIINILQQKMTTFTKGQEISNLRKRKRSIQKIEQSLDAHLVTYMTSLIDLNSQIKQESSKKHLPSLEEFKKMPLTEKIDLLNDIETRIRNSQPNIDRKGKTGIKPMPKLGLDIDDFKIDNLDLKPHLNLTNKCLIGEDGKIYYIIDSSYDRTDRMLHFRIKMHPTNGIELEDFAYTTQIYTLKISVPRIAPRKIAIYKPNKPIDRLLLEKQQLTQRINDIQNSIMLKAIKNILPDQWDDGKMNQLNDTETNRNRQETLTLIKEIEDILNSLFIQHLTKLIQQNMTEASNRQLPDIKTFEQMELIDKTYILHKLSKK